ncbi:uncharacterized protein LOC112559929 isoform X2 [Pomacea canaliculata]|uniref:uncharacterized protein LOC112559929 isoform X2 n=2 Tax=Pomacea canaliculata TaxID=400727 RepID=UPI000D7278DD|nr:uncharacterized protein LOC112559929 isoform X2 [Pomacea canaliculata]
MVWINRYHGYALAHRELKFRLLSASQHRQPTEDSLLQAMPSASPLYNFPNGLVDPDCPYRYPGSGDHVPFSGCPVPTDAVTGGGSKLPAEYDPFKYLSAMTEQSLSDSFPSQSTHACAAAASGSQFLFNQSAQIHGGYQCTATSPPAATSSSQQFFASQSPGCCMYSSENSPHAQRMGGFTPGGTDAEGFGMSQTVRGAGGGGDPPACKKNFLCSTEELMESGDSDSLLSWTRQHPEHWSRAEVLDWLFFVAQERGLRHARFQRRGLSVSDRKSALSHDHGRLHAPGTQIRNPTLSNAQKITQWSVVFETGRKSESASSWGLHRPVAILSSVM